MALGMGSWTERYPLQLVGRKWWRGVEHSSPGPQLDLGVRVYCLKDRCPPAVWVPPFYVHCHCLRLESPTVQTLSSPCVSSLWPPVPGSAGPTLSPVHCPCRIVCEMGPAPRTATAGPAHLCVGECRPEFTARSQQEFTFVVSAEVSTV